MNPTTQGMESFQTLGNLSDPAKANEIIGMRRRKKKILNIRHPTLEATKNPEYQSSNIGSYGIIIKVNGTTEHFKAQPDYVCKDKAKYRLLASKIDIRRNS